MKKLLAVLAVVILAAFAAPALAATNPFIDVPASHWAYDAVAQLASRGLISGYPDGTFKGQQPTTRYEIASIIARSLANLDADKASKADVEMMRRLIVEFSDELSALGVTVDEFDGRLGALEADLGGWKFSGVFEFNAKLGEDRVKNADSTGDADWDIDKYRIFLDKRINETTRFHARIDTGDAHSNTDPGLRWDEYYIVTKLPYDIELTAGRFAWDWEDEYGLYGDDDSWMNDIRRQGFGFKKDFGVASFALLLQRLNDDGTGKYWGTGYPSKADGDPSDSTSAEWHRIALNVNADFNEKFSAGLLGYFDLADKIKDTPIEDEQPDLTTFGAYLKFRFHPSVELKGLYYHQDLEDTYITGNNDSTDAWKVILDIDQDLLKFTSLWVEYAQVDTGFIFDTGTNGGYTSWDAAPTLVQGDVPGEKVKVIFAKASQQWNDKWDSWVRYNWVDYENNTTDYINDFSQIGIGIGYQLNPAVHFELGYDHAKLADDTDDNLVHFQTVVNF